MTRKIEIPQPLISLIQSGEVILFLGAGASIGACHPEHKPIPIGNGLRDQLCDFFFEGQLKERTLFDVSKFIIDDYGLDRLQDQIAKIFKPFKPGLHHLAIPNFPWHAIATTNYDRLIEQAYEQADTPVSPIYICKDGDNMDRQIKNMTKPVIPVLKLHGCISRITDESIPLIITPEQYAKYVENRQRLYDSLRGWAHDFCILFCGYSINDPHISKIIFDLEKNKEKRPMYYSVDPSLTEHDIRYWLKYKITIINSSFNDFIGELQNKIDLKKAMLATKLPRYDHSIVRFFTTISTSVPEALSYFLDEDATHVTEKADQNEQADPKKFFSGIECGWSPIRENLDIRRRVTDDVLADNVLTEVEEEEGQSFKFILLKGPAGNGKTIALKRIAWDAANVYGKLVLFISDTGILKIKPILELLEKTSRTLFICIDRAALHTEELLEISEQSKRRNLNITIITAERDHEWHSYCSELEKYLSEEYSVRYLSEGEIHELLGKLDKYKQLGILEDLSYEERFRKFDEFAGRQLLVALHEVTQGFPFKEIVFNEYERIIPPEARYLYLDVCSLNQFGVPVRAGSISRISEISFTEFREKLFDPLSNVVRSYFNKSIHDNVYQTRHPHVAEIVFNTVLNDPEKKFEQFIRILDGINLEYSTDVLAFREIIRSKHVIDSFASTELGHRFYDKAIEVTRGKDPHVYQQASIFELNHAGGSFGRASTLLKKALELAPQDLSIKHTYANLRRRQALSARTELERNSLRAEARGILATLKNKTNILPYPYFTGAQIDFDELKEALSEAPPDDQEDNVFDRRIVDLMLGVENSLGAALQRFPDNDQFLSLEATFRELISDSKRAENALQKAARVNPRNEFISVRLARFLQKRGDREGAQGILMKCIDANPSAKFAHFELGKIYSELGNSKRAIDYLQRSTTEGDFHYEAQFILAREFFLSGDTDKAYELFDKLSDIQLSSIDKKRVRMSVEERTVGKLVNITETYCFISATISLRNIFAHRNNSSSELWRELKANEQVTFRLAFTMRGPTAIDLKSMKI